jgi:hypothetical protein
MSFKTSRARCIRERNHDDKRYVASTIQIICSAKDLVFDADRPKARFDKGDVEFVSRPKGLDEFHIVAAIRFFVFARQRFDERHIAISALGEARDVFGFALRTVHFDSFQQQAVEKTSTGIEKPACVIFFLSL